MICLSELDIEAIEEADTMKGKWAILKAKYSQVLPIEQRANVRALNNFALRENISISDAWTSIKELRRKVVNSKPELKSSYTESVIFEILTKALSKEYSIVVNILDHQNSKSIIKKIYKLKSKEAKLKKAKEKANSAKDLAFRPKQDLKGGLKHHSSQEPRRTSFSYSSRSRSLSPRAKCYLYSERYII